MATETLLPDAIVTLTSLSGTILNIDEGTASADGVFLTNTNTNGNQNLLVASFPTPSGDLTTGDNLQTFRVTIRKNATGGNDPTFQFIVYENGSATTTASPNITVSALSTFSFTWNSNILANQTGADVEIGIQQTGGGTGNAARRRWIEIDTVDWIADYTPPAGGTGFTQAILI